MKKLLLVTGSRGEYGYIRPILLTAKSKYNSLIECDVLATNMHLMEAHGYSLNEFQDDNIDVKYQIWNTLDGSSGITMAKSLCIFGISLCDILQNEKYDGLLLAGDRGEQLISAFMAFHVNIPIYHIQAGEKSGHIDGMTRHAIGKFTHIHFAANADASERLKNLGEEEFRIREVGAPQLDDILPSIMPLKEVQNELSLSCTNKFCLFVFHPVSENIEKSYKEFLAIAEYLKDHIDIDIITIYPNSDNGSNLISNYLDKWTMPRLKKFRNLKRSLYCSLLQYCEFIIGNSSSGIIEAPLVRTAAINIGKRQAGRLQGENVINVEVVNKKSLHDALAMISSESFKDSLGRCLSPYGDGDATEKIIQCILQTETNTELLTKQVTC